MAGDKEGTIKSHHRSDHSTLKTMHEVAKTAQIQQRHLFFWLFIILFSIGLVFLIQHADALFASLPEIEEEATPSLATAITIEVEVQPDGSAVVNNRRTHRLLQPLPEFDELRYKLVDKPGSFINQLVVYVRFPNSLPESLKLQSFAIHGIDDATERKLDDRTLEYIATGLGPEATYTIVAQLPPDSFDWPAWRRGLAWLMGLPLTFWLAMAVLLPLSTIAVLTLMFWSTIQERLRGRPKDQLTALPADIPAAIVGILVHGRVSAREIAATILDLANRGYLSIFSKDQNHFSFAKRRSWEGLRSFELLLLMALFKTDQKAYKSTEQDIELNVGASLFSPAIAKVYVAMYDAATAAGYFKRNPAAIHQRYRLIGLLLFFLGLIAFSIVLLLELEPNAVLFLFAGMMSTALIIIVAADDVPLLTSAGQAARRAWLRFANYLTAPEPLGYIEGSQLYYERFLPYAIVLQAELPWVLRFTHHPFGRPTWYDSSQELPLRIEDFAQGLYRIIGQIADLFASAKEPTVH